MLGPALDIYKSTIQSLCISIPETLLHVTLKRRAEISADIFARLLRYFFLSYKNLTIMVFTEHVPLHYECRIIIQSFQLHYSRAFCKSLNFLVSSCLRVRSPSV